MTVAPSPIPRMLTRSNCLELLGPGGHGRVAAAMRAVPVIIPVKFALLGEDVVFNPSAAEDMSRAIENCVVAFETDELGPNGHARWNVHVTGVARAVADDSAEPGFRLSSEIMTGWSASD